MHKEITSAGNDRVKSIKSLQTKKGRSEQEAFLAEGHKMVSEALQYAAGDVRALLVEKGRSAQFDSLIVQAEAAGADILLVSENVLSAVSDVQTPQGIAAVVATSAKTPKEGARFIIALDGLQDPANVGAIIRTADAAGADAVLLSRDTADHLSPKALRASMGSVFHIDTVACNLPDTLADLKRWGFTLIASHLKGEENIVLQRGGKICVVIGSEARGVREEIAQLCDIRLKIPLFGKAESLNAAVAAGILLYDIARAAK